jgi:hypothetical protein
MTETAPVADETAAASRPGRSLTAVDLYRVVSCAGLFAIAAGLAAVAFQLGEMRQTLRYVATDDGLMRVEVQLEALNKGVTALKPAPAASASASALPGWYPPATTADPVASAIREQTRQMEAAEARRRRDELLSPR